MYRSIIDLIYFAEGVGKKEEKAMIKQRLLEAWKTGQKICIDCSLEEHMSEKVCTVKFLNFWTPENIAVIYLKFKQRRKTLGNFI